MVIHFSHELAAVRTSLHTPHDETGKKTTREKNYDEASVDRRASKRAFPLEIAQNHCESGQGYQNHSTIVVRPFLVRHLLERTHDRLTR
jgi:hypothetical protein